jgi:hypothetical protein
MSKMSKMNKELLNQRLFKIMSQLSTEELFEARLNRNWEVFDKLSELEKLYYRLEELEIYEDILNF